MYLSRRSAQAVASVAFICGLVVFCNPCSAGAAPPPDCRHLSFEPPRNKQFAFIFACRDPKNRYKLIRMPKANKIKLAKVVKGISTALATSDELPEFNTLGVWLRPKEIRAELDNRAVLVSHDTTLRGGTFGFQPYGVVKGIIRDKPLGQVALEEDFEDHEAVRKRWKVLLGSYKIFARIDELALRNGGPPTFCAYQPDGRGGHLAVAGEAHWADLRLRATLRIRTAEKAGLAFNIYDGQNFSVFVVTPGADGQGKAQLIDFRDAVPNELLAKEGLTIERNQWYRLRVETYADQAHCSILGLAGGRWRTIFAGCPGSSATGSGRVGLISWGGGALFDDVCAHSLKSFADPLETLDPSLWKLNGDWACAGGRLEGTGRARTAHTTSGPGRIDVEISAPGAASAAVFTHSPNEKSYYAFGLFGGQWQFKRVVNSVPAVLASAPAEEAEWHRLTLIDRSGIFRCLADDKPVFEVADFALPDLGDGLTGRKAAFSNFRVVRDPEPQGVEIFAADFEQVEGVDRIRMRRGFIVPAILEPSGPVWGYGKHAGRSVLVSDEPATLLFHTPIPGNVSVAATVSRSGRPALIVASDEQGDYRFGIDADGKNAVLYRKSGPITRIPIIGDNDTVKLELVKHGSTLLTYVDSRPMMKLPIRGAPDAGRVGLAAGRGAQFFSMSIRAESATACSFESAAPQWREAGGRWAVHAGLPNPALGHWITGIVYKGTGYLWERLERTGDFVWYVTVAAATEGYADGGSKTFPVYNVHLRFCGSPENSGIGYDLVIRPGGKQSIAVFKGPEKLAEGKLALPNDLPLRVKVHRRGERVEIGINGERALVFEDPDPPAGGHLGLGIMRSRASFLDVLVLPAGPPGNTQP